MCIMLITSILCKMPAAQLQQASYVSYWFVDGCVAA